MGTWVVTLRVVFDTNTVISALLFSKGQLAWLRSVWGQGTVVPLISKSTTQEIVRVLGYRKFHLDAAEQEELLGDFLPYAEIIEVAGRIENLPKCRDIEDQKFLELVVISEAEALVTGDNDLLVLADQFPLPILTPTELHRYIGLENKTS